MADNSGWEKILQGKYKAYDIEKSIYAEHRNKANTPEMYAKFICDHLREGDVLDNLRLMYREAVYGSHPKVRTRIIKRVYSIGQKCRQNENVKEIVMLHAPDYGDMSLNELMKTVGQRKKMDNELKKAMKCVEEIPDIDGDEVDVSEDFSNEATVKSSQMGESTLKETKDDTQNECKATKDGKKPREIYTQDILMKENEDKQETDCVDDMDIPLEKGDVVLNNCKINLFEDNDECENFGINLNNTKKVYGKSLDNDGNKGKTTETKFDKVFEEGTSTKPSGKKGKKVQEDDLFKAFNEKAAVKRKAETDKKKLMRNLDSVAKMAKRALINHDAYVQADADHKNLNLESYRTKIEREMAENDESSDEDKDKPNSSPPHGFTADEPENQMGSRYIAYHYDDWLNGDFEF